MSRRSTSVRAATPATVLRLDRSLVHELLSRCPQ